MAREHARVATSIWSDPDWRTLTVAAQHLYLMLLSQPNTTQCGSLPYTPRRWAQMAADHTAADVDAALAELAAARFVIVDEETDEALIRTFVRNDGVLTQPNVAKNAVGAAEAILSPTLRYELARDLDRHAEDLAELKGWDRFAGWVKSNLNPSPNPSVNPSLNPSGKGCPTPAPSPSPTPVPLTLVAADADDGEDITGRFEAFWTAYPIHHRTGRIAGGGSKKPAMAKWRKLTRAQRDACLIAVDHYRTECEALPDRQVKHPEGWLAEERWETYAEPSTVRSRGAPAHAASDVDDSKRHDHAYWGQ